MIVTPESYRYARLALDHGYRVELREPESEWWQEIRILLKYRPDTRRVLYQWAERLSEMSRQTHRIPASLIRQGMDQWQLDVTLDDILAVGSANSRNEKVPGTHPLHPLTGTRDGPSRPLRTCLPISLGHPP